MTHPIDEAVLDEQTGRDAGLKRDVLGLFITQAEALRDMVAQHGERGGLADALHRMQGSCRAIGALTLGGLSETLEAELRAARPLSRNGGALLTSAIEDACRYAAALHERLEDTASPNDPKAGKHLRPPNPGQRGSRDADR